VDILFLVTFSAFATAGGVEMQ